MNLSKVIFAIVILTSAQLKAVNTQRLVTGDDNSVVLRNASQDYDYNIQYENKRYPGEWMMSVPAAWGALIAAIIALISNCYVSWYKSTQDYKNAYRARLSKIDSEIGCTVYQLLSCCKIYGQKISRSEELSDENQKSQFEKSVHMWYSRAKKQADNLEKLRQRARYVLYGIDEGFRTLVRIPGWISHCSGAPQRFFILLQSADVLRQELDAAILFSYKNGCYPSKSICKKVISAANQVRKDFDETKFRQCDHEDIMLPL